MRFPRRNRPPVEWELMVTDPDTEEPLVHVDGQALEFLWKSSDQRTLDGYVDILQMPRLHLWVKPKGWTEPTEERVNALAGTGTEPRRRL